MSGLKRTVNWREFDDLGMILLPANRIARRAGQRPVFVPQSSQWHHCRQALYLAILLTGFAPLGGHVCWPRRVRACGRVARGCRCRADQDRRGWLVITMGPTTATFYLGALLLDLADPRTVLARSAAH